MQKSYLPHSNPASKKVAPGKLPSVRWRHYDRLPAGEYTAYCRRALTYYDSGFKRFTCLLLWDVLSPEGESIGRVRQWLNLGSKARPRATRRSRYWAAWIAANDGKPPLRSDRLSPEIFNHRVARVVVADSASQPPYSVVREVIRWETGFPKKQSQSRSKTQSLNYSTKAWKKPSVKKKLAIGDVSKKTSALAGVEGKQSNHNPTAGGVRSIARKGSSIQRSLSAEDAVGGWLSSQCVESRRYSTSVSVLFRDFQSWATEAKHISREEFDAALRGLFAVENGFASGIALRADVPNFATVSRATPRPRPNWQRTKEAERIKQDRFLVREGQ